MSLPRMSAKEYEKVLAWLATHKFGPMRWGPSDKALKIELAEKIAMRAKAVTLLDRVEIDERILQLVSIKAKREKTNRVGRRPKDYALQKAVKDYGLPELELTVSQHYAKIDEEVRDRVRQLGWENNDVFLSRLASGKWTVDDLRTNFVIKPKLVVIPTDGQPKAPN